MIRKLNRQERVVEEVKIVLKPHYNKKRITKEEYKDILRKSVPKVRLRFKSLRNSTKTSFSLFRFVIAKVAKSTY